MPKEERIGAQGLPNGARLENMRRYQCSRVIYHAQQMGRLNPEWAELSESIIDEVRMVYDDKAGPAGGEDAATLGVKGKKAANKTKEAEAND